MCSKKPKNRRLFVLFYCQSGYALQLLLGKLQLDKLINSLEEVYGKCLILTRITGVGISHSSFDGAIYFVCQE